MLAGHASTPSPYSAASSSTLRLNNRIEWPALRSSETAACPTTPVPPVTNTFIADCPLAGAQRSSATSASARLRGRLGASRVESHWTPKNVTGRALASSIRRHVRQFGPGEREREVAAKNRVITRIHRAGGVSRTSPSVSLTEPARPIFASNCGRRAPATVAVLYENNTYGRGLADSFRRSFHGDILSLDPINADLPTAEPYISYLKTRKPRIVFVAGRVASGLKILQEAKRQGFNPIFVGGDGWQGILADTATSEGSYIGMSFTPEDPSPAARAFVAAFTKKFNAAPDAHAALAYDATKLVRSEEHTSELQS